MSLARSENVNGATSGFDCATFTVGQRACEMHFSQARCATVNVVESNIDVRAVHIPISPPQGFGGKGICCVMGNGEIYCSGLEMAESSFRSCDPSRME